MQTSVIYSVLKSGYPPQLKREILLSGNVKAYYWQKNTIKVKTRFFLLLTVVQNLVTATTKWFTETPHIYTI